MFYHSFDPVIFQIGPLAVRWYGVSYLVGFLLAWILGRKRARDLGGWESEYVTDLIFYLAWGAILGGRLGYWLFYDLFRFIDSPLDLLKIWEGGMSFHGGLLGVLVSVYFFARKYSKSYSEILDFTTPLAPLAIAIGRIGNFINNELWGRVTDVPWAVVFQHSGGVPRHPSQLYEAILEGFIIFTIVWNYSASKRDPWKVSALFLVCYGIARFIVEFFREPDAHIGYVLFGWMTKGQLLSIPMIVIGISWFVWCRISRMRLVTKKSVGG